MGHPTPLAWSYIVLFGGVAIVLLAIAVAFRSNRNSGPENSRLASLEEKLMQGTISREEYERERARIIAEQYEKHRAA